MNLTPIAKNLRKHQTEAEKLLWSRLRAKQMEGRKFRRQVPIGSYVVDFICHEKKLIIELDGGQHMEPEDKAKDQVRDEWLHDRGYHVMRFWDGDVFKNFPGILETIRSYLD